MTAAIHPLESAGLCDPSPDQTGHGSPPDSESTVFEEITRSPVPYDQRVLRRLAQPVAAGDGYLPLAYSPAELSKETRGFHGRIFKLSLGRLQANAPVQGRDRW